MTAARCRVCGAVCPSCDRMTTAARMGAVYLAQARAVRLRLAVELRAARRSLPPPYLADELRRLRAAHRVALRRCRWLRD